MYADTLSLPCPCPSDVRDEIYAWLRRMTPAASDDTTRYAVTLTFDIDKMRRKSRSGVLELNEATAFARQTFAVFRRNLDRAIFKNAAVRFKRELSYVPVIEGQGKGERIHYHCVIVTPQRVALPEMALAVKHAWMNTEFGAVQTDVQHMLDDGWLSYISKEAWTIKRDAVDVDNVRLGTPPLRR